MTRPISIKRRSYSHRLAFIGIYTLLVNNQYCRLNKEKLNKRTKKKNLVKLAVNFSPYLIVFQL